MPISARSRPRYSSSSLQRIPMVYLMASQTIEAGNHNKGAGCGNTDELGQEAGFTVGKRNSHGAPDTADQVNRESTNDIVNLELVEERNRQYNQNTADSADQCRSTEGRRMQDRQ